jgi:hypothetical protein
MGWTVTDWDPFEPITVGPYDLQARRAAGRGKLVTGPEERHGYAVVVKVPDRNVILFLGAWAPTDKSARRDFIDVIRGMTPCEPVGGVCVPDAP